MKRIRLMLPFIFMIFVALLLCGVAYPMVPQEVKWAARSVVDVPVCASHIAEKLNVQSDFAVVKMHKPEQIAQCDRLISHTLTG